MRHTFFCIDGHTGGTPVRLIAGGAPLVRGANMAERRQDFLERFDWIRTGLCFEPRGHDLMSGGFLYPPTREDADVGLLFIETSGCLPMCGHGTIGLVTFGLEHGLIMPRILGRLRVEIPAGIVDVEYGVRNGRVTFVRFRNVFSYLDAVGIEIDVPGFGPVSIDIAYGGNFYAIIEPQGHHLGIDTLGAARIVELSRVARQLLQSVYEPVHFDDERIRGIGHMLWTDKPKKEGSHGRSAVFYGEWGLDRSACGTGTSARMAHLHAKGLLSVGDRFVHESYTGSHFVGRVEAEVQEGGRQGIIPSIEGSAIATGFNTIWIDRADPFWAGFTVV